MDQDRRSRFDSLWDGTFLWFLAVYCGLGAYSALTSEPADGDKSAYWVLAVVAILLGAFALNEYKHVIFGRPRP